MTPDLNIAEFRTTPARSIQVLTGVVNDGSRWVREGIFREYHRNGQVIAEGMYANGKEQGIWREYYENGQLAAEGYYENGEEVGTWQYWNPDGSRRGD